MNLLLYVIAFLLCLAALSYEALGRFKKEAFLRDAIQETLDGRAVCENEQVAFQLYQTLKKSGGKPLSKEAKEDIRSGVEEGITASSLINFRFFTDSEFASKEPLKASLYEKLLKDLIDLLYGDQPFFQELKQKRDDLVAHLIASLRKKASELAEKDKIGRVDRLMRLELDDPLLQEFWYQLLRKNVVSISVSRALFPKDFSDEEEWAIRCQEVSIRDFLSQKNVFFLRVFLMKRALLLALLKDEATVQAVIGKRNLLFKAVTSKSAPLDQKNAEEEFRKFCLMFPQMALYEPILNFAVTKTNPKEYEY